MEDLLFTVLSLSLSFSSRWFESFAASASCAHFEGFKEPRFPWPPPSLMELCLTCLPLVTLLTLLTSEVTPSFAQKVYTNTWAVHISGGEEEVNRVAQKYGFINHGNVSIVRAVHSDFGGAVIFEEINLSWSKSLLAAGIKYEVWWLNVLIIFRVPTWLCGCS